MRHPVRREAGRYLQAGWWLVPLVFASAAVAAVVLRGGEDPEWAVTTLGIPEPAAQPAVVPALPVTPAAVATQPQPEEPSYQEEHVQAF